MNKNNIEKYSHDINTLVVANIITCEKNNRGVIYDSSPIKYIFEKTNIKGRDVYKDAQSNTEIECFDDPFVDFNKAGKYITNVESLTDYINSYKGSGPNESICSNNIPDIQDLVNIINKNIQKTKKRA